MQPGLTQSPVQFNYQLDTPQASPYASGLGGFLERALPTIGSIGGSVLGSLVAPVAGTTVGGAAGGLLGQKLEDVLTHQHSSGKTYLEQAALGGLTGIGKTAAAAKGAVNAVRGGEGLGEAANILRTGTGAGVNAVASASGKTVAGAAGEGLKGFGNRVLSTGAQGLGTGRLGVQLQDALPGVTSKMADYGFTRPSQWEQVASKVTGNEGVLNTVKNNILQRAEKNGASVDLTGWHPTDLATPRSSGYGGSFVGRSQFNPNLADPQSVITKAITDNNLAFDKQGANTVWGAAKAASQAMTDAGNTPTKVFDAIKGLENQAAKAYSSGKTDVGSALRQISTDLRGRLDQATQHEVIMPKDVQTMVQGLKDQGVTNPNLLRDVKNLNGAPALGIRGIEKTFVDASHIGAATRRATQAQEGQMANRGGFFGLGGLMQPVERTAVGTGRQVVGRGARGVGSLIGKVASKETAGEAPTAGQAATRALKTQVPARLLTGTLAPGQPPANQQASASDLTALNQLPSTTTPATQAQDTGPFSQAAVERAILTDIAATGGKNISKIESLYKTLGPGSTSAKLSANEQTNVDNFNRANASLQNYQRILDSIGGPQGPIEGRVSSLLGRFGVGGNTPAVASALDQTKLETATAIAKALTGSARPAANIIEQWKNALPGVADPPATAKAKLDNIISSIEAQKQAQITQPASGTLLGQ